MSGHPRGAPQEIVARQIDLICAPQLTSAERLTATQNGGPARVLAPSLHNAL
jgi:hypothetical protein